MLNVARGVALAIFLLIAGLVGTYYTWGDITGGDEVDEWCNITITNMNAIMVASIGAIGGLSAALVFQIYNKKRGK